MSYGSFLTFLKTNITSPLIFRYFCMTKAMKRLTILFCLLLLAACSSVNVIYDYDKAADFSAYSTYNYYPEIDPGLNNLDARRLYNAIDSTLRSKGIQLSEEPDFYINIQSNYYSAPSNSSVGVGLGGGGGNVGGGVSVGVPIGGASLEREIIFDLIDSQRDVLLWQAISKGNLKENETPSKKEARIQALVAKVFSKYPPVIKSKNK